MPPNSYGRELSPVPRPLPEGIGIDGCKAGWCSVHLRRDCTPRLLLHNSLAGLLQELSSCANPDCLLLLDMPLGLPHAAAPVRSCDVQARRLLGRRGVTVFAPTCREALQASDYVAACEINKTQVGRKLSKQAFNITPKIRECDELLHARPQLHDFLLEAHPELAFASLAGAPLQANKRTHEGRKHRLALLQQVVPHADDFLESALGCTQRRHMAADDVLDALALAWAASLGRKGLRSLPLDADEYDNAGLPMRILVPVGAVSFAQLSGESASSASMA